VSWIELRLRLSAAALPQIEALLELAGAESFSLADAGDAPILEPAAGMTPLWPELTLRALFAVDTDIAAISALLADSAATEISLSQLSDAEALARTPEPIRPLVIGPRLKIVPAAALADCNRQASADVGPAALGLDMGLAFGTGQHPTTRLCLQWLERNIAGNETVLDYGAGSGVLALAALRLGAATALAIDNEPQALEATRSNAQLNGLESRLRTGPPELLSAGTFDLILANILAGTLTGLASTFAGLQASGGRIVLSGILAAQLDAVETAYAMAGYVAFSRREHDGWCLLTAARRNEYDR